MYSQNSFVQELMKINDSEKETFIKDELSNIFKKDSLVAFSIVNTSVGSLPSDLRAFVFQRAGIESLRLKSNDRAMKYFRMAYVEYKKLKNFNKVVPIVKYISKVFVSKNELDSAVTYLFNEIKQVQGNNLYEAIIYNRIGVVFKELNNTNKAFEYLQKSDEKFSSCTNLSGEAEVSLIDNDKNLGVLYRNNKNYEKALFYLTRSLERAEKINNEVWIGIDLNSIGILYMEIGNNKKAIECLEKSVKLKSQTENLKGIATSYGNLGKLYIKVNKFPEAKTYFENAYDLAKKTNDIRLIEESSTNLYLYFEKIGQIEKSFSFLKEAFDAKDSVFRFNIVAESAKIEAIYENDKKSREIELSNIRNNELRENLLLKERNQKGLIIGSVLLLGLLGWSLWSYYGKRIANKELSGKNEEINQQKIILEHHNKEILDSINYAQKIQVAILPKVEDLRTLFKDSFVLYKPKNIVSGDFYWVSEKDNFIFFATADCTGHGVPGGFMSMLASSILNEIVNESNINEPSQVLNLMRQKVIQALKQKGEVGENKDGMDMCFCRLDKTKNEIVIAAANNPVWLVKSGNMISIKPDKFPVGISAGELIPFKQERVSLSPGDFVYTFTDGYPDQFGGPKGKKFMYKQFQEILLNIHSLPCMEQLQYLEKKLNEWKGDLEQVDDICVVGIRI